MSTIRGSLPPQTQARLAAYVELLRIWAPKLGLVSEADLPRLETRHIEDSLTALSAVRAEPEGAAVDVGSGAGLPGIPLALATPERPWRLLEPRLRRVAFLEEALRELDLDAEVIPLTAEQAAQEPHLAGAHRIATARALAPPAQTEALCAPLVSPGGVVLMFSGRSGKRRGRPGDSPGALASIRVDGGASGPE